MFSPYYNNPKSAYKFQPAELKFDQANREPFWKYFFQKYQKYGQLQRRNHHSNQLNSYLKIHLHKDQKTNTVYIYIIKVNKMLKINLSSMEIE